MTVTSALRHRRPRNLRVAPRRVPIGRRRARPTIAVLVRDHVARQSTMMLPAVGLAAATAPARRIRPGHQCRIRGAAPAGRPLRQVAHLVTRVAPLIPRVPLALERARQIPRVPLATRVAPRIRRALPVREPVHPSQVLQLQHVHQARARAHLILVPQFRHAVMVHRPALQTPRAHQVMPLAAHKARCARCPSLVLTRCAKG